MAKRKQRPNDEVLAYLRKTHEDMLVWLLRSDEHAPASQGIRQKLREDFGYTDEQLREIKGGSHIYTLRIELDRATHDAFVKLLNKLDRDEEEFLAELIRAAVCREGQGSLQQERNQLK